MSEYSLYEGYDHYGVNVNLHLGNFKTEEDVKQAIIAHKKTPNHDMFYIKIKPGIVYPGGTDADIDNAQITYV